MKIRTYLSFFLLLFSIHFSFSQMVVGQDTLVGNEWIRYGQPYFKFLISQDGVYRVPASVLQSAGIDADDIKGSELRIYNMGKQVPLHVSTSGIFGPDDYIEFFGYQNRSALDQFLFRTPEQDMLNPDYSIYTDLNAYYVAYEGVDIPARVNTILNNVTNPPAQEDYFMHREYINYHSDPLDP